MVYHPVGDGVGRAKADRLLNSEHFEALLKAAHAHLILLRKRLARQALPSA